MKGKKLTIENVLEYLELLTVDEINGITLAPLIGKIVANQTETFRIDGIKMINGAGTVVLSGDGMQCLLFLGECHHGVENGYVFFT